MSTGVQSPIYPQFTDDQMNQLVELLRLRDQATPNAPASTGWLMTNVTPDRVLDADSTSTAELADVLATLIDDLKTAGYLGD